MTVNLQKHGPAMLDAFNQLLHADGQHWLILDYEGKSNVLKIGDQGEDGLEEFASSFNSGRLQYGLIPIRVAASTQPKVVLVQWQGEGVPSSLLGSSANHIREVKLFFKGVHVVIHARNEDDVEPSAILKAVAKLPGAGVDSQTTNAHAHADIPERGPVKSVYEPTRPNQDPALITDRQQFWKNVQQQEDQRLLEEGQRMKAREADVKREREELTKHIHDQRTRDEDSRKEAHHVSQTKKEATVPSPHSPIIQAPPPIAREQQVTPSFVAEEEEEDEKGAMHTAIEDDEPVADGGRGHDGSLRAIALWDYQAGDDTEISFDPDDEISHIEMIDDGWWRGRAPDGRIGLFPANFVQLLS